MSSFARRLQRVQHVTTPVDPITQGSQVNAGNTGIAGIGVARSSLTVVSTPTTVSANGGVISNTLFTSGLTITGDNVRISGCQIETNGSNAIGLQLTGDNAILEDTTIVANGGSSMFTCIVIAGNDITVRRVDASMGENIITVTGSTATIIDSYLHDTSNLANPAAVEDVIEVYGGSNCSIQRNRIFMHNDQTSCITVSPWSGATSSNNTAIDDNWIDGGNAHILINLQSTGTVNGTKVRRNIMGGHTNPSSGIYVAFQNTNGRAIVETTAAQTASPGSVLWPTSGADASHWGDCSDLSPNNTGQIVIP